jgi:hypothetical protein
MTLFRRPALKLIKPDTGMRARSGAKVSHDYRGNAVWTGGEVSIEDTGTLALVPDEALRSGFEGDPYNRTQNRPTSRSAHGR